jgi:hypothetical protein
LFTYVLKKQKPKKSQKKNRKKNKNKRKKLPCVVDPAPRGGTGARKSADWGQRIGGDKLKCGARFIALAKFTYVFLLYLFNNKGIDKLYCWCGAHLISQASSIFST